MSKNMNKTKMLNVMLIISALILTSLLLMLIGLTACGYEVRIVISGSMEPYLRTGTYCLIDTDYDYDELKVGDVILFKVHGKENDYMHRIVSIDDKGIVTKGDANEKEDEGYVYPWTYKAKLVMPIPGTAWIGKKVEHLN